MQSSFVTLDFVVLPTMQSCGVVSVAAMLALVLSCIILGPREMTISAISNAFLGRR